MNGVARSVEAIVVEGPTVDTNRRSATSGPLIEWSAR
jgi:hypothetical protein